MFENIGGKLKFISKIVLVIGIIAEIVQAVLSEGTLLSLSLIVSLIVGILSSILYSLVIYAIGEIYESNEEILRILKSNDNTTSHLSFLSSTSSNTHSGWTCPQCDEANSNSTRICKSCGYQK